MFELNKKTLFKEKLHSPRGDVYFFYFFYFLFVINDKILNSKKLKKFLWDLVKCELFYCAGYCKHTGNCCQNLLFMKKGIWCNDLNKFNRLKKKESGYNQFQPICSSSDDSKSENKKNKKIKYFSCSLLTVNNYCSDYDARPQFCKNYPMSNFLLYDYIPQHCGYKILRKNISPHFKNKTFVGLYKNVVKLNSYC